MKPTILAITLALSLAAIQIPSANAHDRGNMQKDEQRIFAGLNLSKTQKQDIGEIMRQTKQDNSVFKGERQAIAAQMRSLMDMEVWNPSAAQDIVAQRINQSGALELNRANAQHKAFNLLDESQQAKFLSKQSNANKQKDKREKLNIARMGKRLELSNEQVTALTQIQETHIEESAALKASLKATKEAERALVFAPKFDQDAWMALQQSAVSTRVELGVAKSYSHYQMLGVLDDEQKETFEKMLDKRQGAKGKRKNKRAV